MVVKMKQGSRAAGLLKRGACCVLAASLCFVGPGAYGLTAWADPTGSGDGDGDAAQSAKTVNLGADVLTAPEGGWTADNGNYLYFGTHDGYVDDGAGSYTGYNDRDTISPTKYRVLSNADDKVLLDSDELLWVDQYKKRYYYEPRDYADSDVNAYLKDAKTLTGVNKDGSLVEGNTSLFSDEELNSIESTSLEAKEKYTVDGLNEGAYYYETAATDVKAFILSADEANTYYATTADAGKTFAPQGAEYVAWLRSKVDASVPLSMDTPHYAGFTYNGKWGYDCMDQLFGVAPAAYLNTSNILFTTDNSFDKTQNLAQVSTTETQIWKATLQQDGDFTVTSAASDEDGIVTVNYTYENSKVDASQISLLIASDDLDAGGEVVYYGKASDAPTETTGWFSFTLPDGLPDGYKVYAFAEDVNGEGYTDYATTPVELGWDCTVSFDALDGADPATKKVDNGGTVTKPSDPVREGYSFGGWYTDTACTAGNEYDFGATVDKSFTLYAKWTENPGWERLAGGTAIGTMKQIVNEGWDSSEYAIVATNKSYHDALAASGLAGLLNAPVLLTAQDSLTPATKALIEAKGVGKVVVVGGPDAVSEDVFSQIEAIDGVSAERVAGGTAVGTANKIYDYGNTLLANGDISEGWGADAVVATAKSYQDAASIAPYAYAKHAPVFLTGDELSAGTATRATAASFTRTLIIGSEQAVSADVEARLTAPTRLGGGTAYGTCKKVAEFCLQNGMTAEHMGVATGQSFQDAAMGAALCGKNNSILVLADDGNSANVDSVIAPHKADMVGSSYIFGGEPAVSAAVEKKIVDATK